MKKEYSWSVSDTDGYMFHPDYTFVFLKFRILLYFWKKKKKKKTELVKQKDYARCQGCKNLKNDLWLPVANGRFAFAVD